MRTVFTRIRDRAPAAMAAAFIAYPLGFVAGAHSTADRARSWQIDERPSVIEVMGGETRHVALFLRFDLLSRAFALEVEPAPALELHR